MKEKTIHSRTAKLVIGLLLIVICILSTCLFLYFDGKNNVGKTATVVFSYSDDVSKMVIDNSTPITDEVGKNITFVKNVDPHGYTEFSISSNMVGLDSIRYEIYAKNIGVSTEIPHGYVKLYLTDGDNDLALDGFDETRVPTFKDLRVASSDPAAKQIYSGKLAKGEIRNFKLRMWLTDTYPITIENRSFGILLYVKVIN